MTGAINSSCAIGLVEPHAATRTKAKKHGKVLKKFNVYLPRLTTLIWLLNHNGPLLHSDNGNRKLNTQCSKRCNWIAIPEQDLIDSLGPLRVGLKEPLAKDLKARPWPGFLVPIVA